MTINSRTAALGILAGLAAFLTLFALACLSGCAVMDDYERSYSLSASDGKQTISAGVVLKPRTPYRP